MANNKKQTRRKPGARHYADYSEKMLEIAADLVGNKVISSYEAEKQFVILVEPSSIDLNTYIRNQLVDPLNYPLKKKRTLPK